MEKQMRHYFLKRKAADEQRRRELGLPYRPMEEWDYSDGWVVKGDVRKCFDAIWQASHRLSETVIENKDFEAFDTAVLTVTTPYFLLRSAYYERGHYEVVFRKEDHMRLRDTLKACRGKWMVSYNDCDFIRELYDGYYITAVTRLNNLAQRYEGGCEFSGSDYYQL